MKRILMLTVVLAAIALFAPPTLSQTRSTVVVIVNASNPTTSLTREAVSRLFLKRDTRWPGGAPVAPIDLELRSTVKDAFAREFHDRSAAAVESYWQQQIFSGRETPPPTRSSETDVVAFVASNRNAIGYISATAKLSADVKVLRIRED